MFDFEDDASSNPTFYADLTNPQSLNKYQYTYNNPYKYNDPSGHCPAIPWLCPAVPAAGAAVADFVGTAVTGFLIGAAGGTVVGTSNRTPNENLGDGSCPSCDRNLRASQIRMAKANSSSSVTPRNTGQSNNQASGSMSGSGGGNNKKIKPTGKTASGRKTDSKGRPLGPSGRVMQHNTRPSTRKQALDKVRNKKGSNGVVIDKKNKFKGNRVDTHGHPVDKNGNRIEKDKEHVYLPKRNNPPKNP